MKLRWQACSPYIVWCPLGGVGLMLMVAACTRMGQQSWGELYLAWPDWPFQGEAGRSGRETGETGARVPGGGRWMDGGGVEGGAHYRRTQELHSQWPIMTATSAPIFRSHLSHVLCALGMADIINHSKSLNEKVRALWPLAYFSENASEKSVRSDHHPQGPLQVCVW